MNLSERLKKWNGGIQRGAASKFAAKMGVGPSAVTMWVKGTRPGEELLQRIARELGVSVPEAEAMFPARDTDLRGELAELRGELARLQSQVNDMLERGAKKPRLVLPTVKVTVQPKSRKPPVLPG